MDATNLQEYILSGGADPALITCGTSHNGLAAQRNRCVHAVQRFADLFGSDRCISLLSVGGRTEIGGNHTDHNLGKVIAASVNMDILATASPRQDDCITVHSEGFAPDTVHLCQADAPDPDAFFTSKAMIAGMVRGFLDRGYRAGGFDAYTTSCVPQGSGLSSSAAFSVMIGNILNNLYNDGAVENAEIAKIAQYAENTFFGKPCGLMDQLACAVGGIIHIDFANPGEPEIQKINYDLTAAGYTLCIVNTGGSHADLNEEYASIPREMKQVAALFNRPVLRGIQMQELLARTDKIRQACGDRALLRAIHFIQENERVSQQADALCEGRISDFLELILESGNSSFRYLQNGYAPKDYTHQGLSLALCLTEAFLSEKNAAWRLHGGGFAGTIQVFVPSEIAREYKQYIESFFGTDACHMISIRQAGACCIYHENAKK